MSVIRLVLLLVVSLGLGVFALQNWSPVLAIAFLGVKTIQLPLSVWILMALAAGAIASWILQQLNYFSKRPLLARIRKLEAGTSPPFADRRQSDQIPEPTDDNYSDWVDEEESDSDDRPSRTRDGEEFSRDKSSSEDVASSAAYEIGQEPKSSSKSGSVYSYSYQKPSDSGVGKTELVRDADYRVITPPYRQPAADDNADDWGSKGEDDEDWGFEDDEFE